MYDKYSAKRFLQCLKMYLHVSYSCRNVFFNPFEVFILEAEHRVRNCCSKFEKPTDVQREKQPNVEPTSLLNSFWEPLESGFEPLIFIPSMEQTIIVTGL